MVSMYVLDQRHAETKNKVTLLTEACYSKDEMSLKN